MKRRLPPLLWAYAMLVLAGCGQKGALYLPHSPAATSAVPVQQPAPEQKKPIDKNKATPTD